MEVYSSRYLNGLDTSARGKKSGGGVEFDWAAWSSERGN